ncbi:MAG: T9SS type A sorting domain-containing protein [Ignavibacteria bacterium]|nr:T9SS type A sorting domain-containing protein [Ignavibacteria bacterium]
MKSIWLSILFIFSTIASYSQIVTKDSVSFNNDFTETTLYLEFAQSLSQDSIHASGLPFSFAIMAPYDSISISSVSFNDAFTNYQITFNTKPKTYYSLLTLDIKTEDKDWHSYSTNFYTDSEISFPSIKIQQSTHSFIITKQSSDLDNLRFEDFLYHPVITTLVINPNHFFDFIKKHGEHSLNKINDSLFQRSINSSFSYHYFQSQDINFPLNQYYEVEIMANPTDTVILYSMITSRNNENHDYLIAPLTTNNYLGNQNEFDFPGLFNQRSDYMRPLQAWNDVVIIALYNYWVGLEHTNNDFDTNQFKLIQSYPNPFNPSTTLTFSLANSSSISFSVYDVLGRRIQSLEHKNLRYSAGTHSFMYDFSGLPSGTYFIEAIGTELGSGQVSRQVAKVSLVK